MRYSFLSLLLASASVLSAQDWYIASSGSDTTTSGTYAKPFKNFSYASSYVKPGDSLIVKNGTNSYTTSQIFAGYGTSAKPITLRAETDYAAYIQGPLTATDIVDPPTPSNQFNLLVVAGSYVTVRGLYLRRSTGIGLLLAGEGTNGVNLISVEHWGTGIEISPNYNATSTLNNKLSSSYVGVCVLANSPSHRTVGGWPAALIAKRASNCVITNCNSEYNYGEGICFSICNGGSITNNKGGDNWGANVYLDNTQGTSSSYIPITGNTFINRGDTRFQRSGYNAMGVTLAVENLNGSTYVQPTRYVSISNNTVTNAAYGVFFPAWSVIAVKSCSVQKPTFTAQSGVYSQSVQFDYSATAGFYTGSPSNYGITVY